MINPVASMDGRPWQSESKTEFVRLRIQLEIEWTLYQMRRGQRKANVIKIGMLSLAALSTAILGWNGGDGSSYNYWSRNIALVLGAFGTLLGSIGAFWNVENFWLTTKGVYWELRDLRDQLCYRLAGSAEMDDAEALEYFDRMRAIVRKRKEYWEGVIKKASDGARAQDKT